MKLIKMEITGFKNFIHNSFEFGMKNEVTGQRGCGKTALLEAIVWCLKGCDLTGNTRGIRSRIKNAAVKEIRVVTTWEVMQADGHRQLTFCRISKSRLTSLSLDDVACEQDTFDQHVGPTDLMLSILSPGYLRGIAGSRYKNVILSILPTLAHASVFMRMPQADQDRLKHFDLAKPLKCLAELKTEAEEWDDEVSKIEARISVIDTGNMLNGNEQEKEKELQSLTSLREQIEALHADRGPADDHIEKLKRMLSQLGEEYREKEQCWISINNEPLTQSFKPDERAGRLREMEKIKQLCSHLLEQGFALKTRIQGEEDLHLENLRVFEEQKKHDMQQIQNEIERIQAKTEIRRQNEMRAKSKELLLRQRLTALEERDQTLSIIQSIQDYLMLYASQQIREANLELKHAEIVLQSRKDSKGQVSLYYNLLYDKQPLQALSSTQLARFSFELSKLTATMLGHHLPVFIDNGDSVEDYPEEHTQFFATSLKPNTDFAYHVVA